MDYEPEELKPWLVEVVDTITVRRLVEVTAGTADEARLLVENLEGSERSRLAVKEGAEEVVGLEVLGVKAKDAPPPPADDDPDNQEDDDED